MIFSTYALLDFLASFSPVVYFVIGGVLAEIIYYFVPLDTWNEYSDAPWFIRVIIYKFMSSLFAAAALALLFLALLILSAVDKLFIQRIGNLLVVVAIIFAVIYLNGYKFKWGRGQ